MYHYHLTNPVILCKDILHFGNTNIGEKFIKKCIDFTCSHMKEMDGYDVSVVLVFGDVYVVQGLSRNGAISFWSRYFKAGSDGLKLPPARSKYVP